MLHTAASCSVGSFLRLGYRSFACEKAAYSRFTFCASLRRGSFGMVPKM